MSSQPFVHLHCHSHYSLLDGQSKIPDLVDRVKTLGMPAVAITDHGNLFGAIEFLREAKAAGIVPIVGLEAYVAPGKRTDRTVSSGGSGDERYAYHLTLLATMASVSATCCGSRRDRTSRVITTSPGSTRRSSPSTAKG